MRAIVVRRPSARAMVRATASWAFFDIE